MPPFFKCWLHFKYCLLINSSYLWGCKLGNETFTSYYKYSYIALIIYTKHALLLSLKANIDFEE